MGLRLWKGAIAKRADKQNETVFHLIIKPLPSLLHHMSHFKGQSVKSHRCAYTLTMTQRRSEIKRAALRILVGWVEPLTLFCWGILKLGSVPLMGGKTQCVVVTLIIIRVTWRQGRVLHQVHKAQTVHSSYSSLVFCAIKLIGGALCGKKIKHPSLYNKYILYCIVIIS